MTDFDENYTLIGYDSALKSKLPIEYIIYYVWPQALAAATLGQEASEKVTRECTFQYSTFEAIATGE